MMKSARQRYLSPGFTLVEIMVSMLIALIVMGGVYRTLVDESVEHDRSEKILDMQNNARVVLGRLTRDIRRAGFLGCGGEQDTTTTLTSAGTDATMIGKLTVAREPVDVAVDPPGALRNFTYTTILKQLNATGGIDYLGQALGFNDNAPADHEFYQEGTDAITLVYLTDERAVVTPAAPGDSTLPITLTSAGFGQDDILYATDCQSFSLFQKTNGEDIVAPFLVKHELAGLNSSGDLGIVYGLLAPARVFKLTTETYFIDKANYTLAHNDRNDSRALASNIEDLQFEFLADEDNDGNLTDEVWRTNITGYTSSKDVQAMRIWVLAMSDTDFTYTDTNTYDYPNSPYCSTTWNADPLSSCSGEGSPASLAPAGPPKGANRHRFLASATVYLRNSGLND